MTPEEVNLKKLAFKANQLDNNEAPGWYSVQQLCQTHVPAGTTICYTKNAQFISACTPKLVIDLFDAKQRLSNLMARIHRDGGHYEEAHGMLKTAIDADTLISQTYEEVDRLQQANEKLEQQLGQTTKSLAHVKRDNELLKANIIDLRTVMDNQHEQIERLEGQAVKTHGKPKISKAVLQDRIEHTEFHLGEAQSMIDTLKEKITRLETLFTLGAKDNGKA